jgi:hypothetical protein
MLKKILFLLFTIVFIGEMSAQKCDYTVNSWYWKFDGEDVGNLRNVTIHDPTVAANYPLSNIGNNPPLAIKGGDVICLDAAVSFRFLTWVNITGEKENPVIIKNINGQVKIRSVEVDGFSASYAWKFKNSKYFKLLGNGDSAYKYGFKVTTHKNSYIQMIDKTTDFEIAYVEVAGDYANGMHATNSGFAGIMAKSQPICWDDENGGSTDAVNFEMKNVSIHDNYIHDVAGEGMYVGYGRVQGVQLNASNGDKCSRINYPHHVSNLFIYNNIVENVGWDGIQVKNAHKNAQVYNNVIKNYATLGIGPHDEGLFVGDGSEAVIHGNWIEKGNTQSNGMQINAYGNTKIYNNVVLGAGYNGLYLNNQSESFAKKDGKIEIYNNTVEGGTGSAIITHTAQEVIIKNNIGFGYEAYHGVRKPTVGIASSNIEEKLTEDVNFENYANNDIRIKSEDSSINNGENHDFDAYDFTGSIRDTSIDIGALEYGSVVDNVAINVAITNPSTNTYTISDEQDILINASLTDANNKVKLIEYELNNSVIGTNYTPNKLEHTIGYQYLIQGTNTLNIKVTLYGGISFYSGAITIQNNSVLSVESENLLENRFHYYYNSNNKELVLNRLDDTEITAVEIYDLLGKKTQNWKSKQVSKNTTRLTVNHLSKGVYVVRIITDKGVLSKKILM